MHDVSRLFAAQDGLASTAQLRELGVSDGVIRQRVGTGEWERVDGRTIGAASTPVTWRRQVRAALLAAGADAAVAGPTAGRLHGFDGLGGEAEIHLVTFDRRHHTPLPGIHLQRSRAIARRMCLEVGGLLTVSRPIALMQIAGRRGRDVAGQALDGMLRDGDNPIWIEGVMREWKRPGVSGPTLVLELLHERVDSRLPRSWFQRLAKGLLASNGIALVDEHPVQSADGRLLAELDLAMPSLQIGVECQSWQWHSTPTARAADARRRRCLRLLGWELVEVWWTDLERIDDIAEEIRYLVARRSPGSGP